MCYIDGRKNKYSKICILRLQETALRQNVLYIHVYKVFAIQMHDNSFIAIIHNHISWHQGYWWRCQMTEKQFLYRRPFLLQWRNSCLQGHRIIARYNLWAQPLSRTVTVPSRLWATAIVLLRICENGASHETHVERMTVVLVFCEYIPNPWKIFRHITWTVLALDFIPVRFFRRLLSGVLK
jgi:hypothetical protein